MAATAAESEIPQNAKAEPESNDMRSSAEKPSGVDDAESRKEANSRDIGSDSAAPKNDLKPRPAEKSTGVLPNDPGSKITDQKSSVNTPVVPAETTAQIKAEAVIQPISDGANPVKSEDTVPRKVVQPQTTGAQSNVQESIVPEGENAANVTGDFADDLLAIMNNFGF